MRGYGFLSAMAASRSAISGLGLVTRRTWAGGLPGILTATVRLTWSTSLAEIMCIPGYRKGMVHSRYHGVVLKGFLKQPRRYKPFAPPGVKGLKSSRTGGKL